LLNGVSILIKIYLIMIDAFATHQCD
jgi:hypothetical protein